MGPGSALSKAKISGGRGRLHRNRPDLVVAANREATEIRKGSKPTILLDPLAEIALKKLHYRATTLKPRDVFDIAVIDVMDGDALLVNLHEVAGKKDDLLRRLDNIKEDFLQAELAELDIRPRWEKHKKTCWETVRGIIGRIPKPGA